MKKRIALFMLAFAMLIQPTANATFVTAMTGDCSGGSSFYNYPEGGYAVRAYFGWIQLYVYGDTTSFMGFTQHQFKEVDPSEGLLIHWLVDSGGIEFMNSGLNSGECQGVGNWGMYTTEVYRTGFI